MSPALQTRFPHEQTEVSQVLSNSTAGNRSVHDFCQTLYGLDFILHHPEDHNQPHLSEKQKAANSGGGGSGGRGGGVSLGVQLLEVQMEPNTRLKCPSDAPLYADLAAGVWQIVTRGHPDNDQIFEKLDY